MSINIQIFGGIEMKYIRIWVEVYLCMVGRCMRDPSLAFVPGGSQLTCIILCTVVIGGVFDSAVADTFHFRKLVGG